MELIFYFAGGVALFLLGMKLLTDGLKVAAGDALRTLLSKWTSGIIRGILSGILITALVQSSSAVIFATVGFVNAGLLKLRQAVYVIFGSNVGTTFTGWIVAFVGFKLDLQLISMPVLAIGMFLWLTSGGTKRGAFGMAAAGFSVFFLGIDILKTTFETMGGVIPFEDLGSGWLDIIILVFAGMVLTTLMQSSSAALAIVITAVAGGLVPLEAAAAMAIGADIGTTSTALFAVFGATSNAKRTALAHVMFNVVNGLFAIPLIGIYLSIVLWIGGPGMSVEITVAAFHTFLKIVGLCIMIPASGWMVRFLERLFVKDDKDEARLKYLDENVVETPFMAVGALVMESKRIGRKTRKLLRKSFLDDHVKDTALKLDMRRQEISRLNMGTAEFISTVQGVGMPDHLEHVLPDALRVLNYFEDAADRAMMGLSLKPKSKLNPQSAKIWDDIRNTYGIFLGEADSETEGFNIDQLHERLNELEKKYQSFKTKLLTEGASNTLPVREMVAWLDYGSTMRRSWDQLYKAARYMDEFNQLIERIPGTGPELEEELQSED